MSHVYFVSSHLIFSSIDQVLHPDQVQICDPVVQISQPVDLVMILDWFGRKKSGESYARIWKRDTNKLPQAKSNPGTQSQAQAVLKKSR